MVKSEVNEITREWLLERGACVWDVDAFLRLFGGAAAPVSLEALERARAAGLNVLWLGLQMATPEILAGFIAFTVQQRRELLASHGLGQVAPADWRKRAERMHREWEDRGDHATRNIAAGLREMARDADIEATPARAERAARAAGRLAALTDGEKAVEDAQVAWLSEKLEVRS